MISFYTRLLLLLRRPPCQNKHGAACMTDTTRHVASQLARHVVLVVWYATSGILAYLTKKCSKWCAEHTIKLLKRQFLLKLISNQQLNLRQPNLSYSRFRQLLKTFLFGKRVEFNVPPDTM